MNPNPKGYWPFRGRTFCPGRIFARHEIFAFVALVLDCFHLTPLQHPDDVIGATKVPNPNVDVPPSTSLSPKGDFYFRLKRKDAGSI